jgi:hypothetical protein
MADKEDMIKAASAEAEKHIKKIVASRGRLQGNFYYVGDTKGSEAAIVITLTTRDPKGQKATSQGKKLRGEISGAKFARGTVTSKGSKLLLELHTGNATKDHMKLGFKNAFTDKTQSTLKKMLKKALIGKPGESAPPEEEESPEESALFALTEEEREEMEALLIEQGPLLELNEQLLASFLSTAETRQEMTELTQGIIGEIESLEGASPRDEAAIAAKRRELAEALYIGDDPFPEVGTPLPDEVQQIFSIATDRLSESLTLFADQYWTQSVDNYLGAVRTVDSQLEALKRELLTRDDEDLTHIANVGLSSLTADKRIPLEAALLDCKSAPSEEKVSRRQRAGKLADAFLQHILDSEKVSAVDNNPVGVSVTVRATLQPVLTHLTSAAQA